MQLVLFDVDGTLVDSQHMIVAAMTRAFEGEGIACPPREAILSIVGLSLPEAMAVLGGDVRDFPCELLAARYRGAFFELRRSAEHQEPLYPGARDVIEALAGRDDVVLGLATGKSIRGVRAILELHGLDGRFMTIQTADANRSKPAPDMILNAMAEVGAEPGATVMVGDTSYDMIMARAAGARGVGVGWGYHPPAALHDAGAAAVIQDFAALHAVLDGLNGPAATSGHAVRAGG